MPQATGGTGATSAFNNQVVTLLSQTTSVVPQVEVTYVSSSEGSGGTQVTTRTTISGSQTPTLTLNADRVGIQTVRAVIDHPSRCLDYYQTTANQLTGEYPIDYDVSDGAFDGGIASNTATFETISAANRSRSFINAEFVSEASDDSAFSSQNLFLNQFASQGDPDEPAITATVIYAPEEDLTVRITLAAAAGQGFNGNSGGEGGITIFTYTLKRNTEYVFKTGATVEPAASIGRGGAGAYFYEKGRLLVACGGGGGSGWSGGNGGDGGGAGIGGASGSGAGAGTGAIRIADGQLTASGELPSGTAGGKIESCTTGIYWSRQGKSPCEDVGSTVWRDFDGDEVDVGPTATITRGYKSSDENLYGYRNNGGNSSTSIRGTFVGGGGAGARGGNAATSASGGGGGGSGYTSGDVVIIDSRQGGNRSNRAWSSIELV
jgi:hypothetical protein